MQCRRMRTIVCYKFRWIRVALCGLVVFVFPPVCCAGFWFMEECMLIDSLAFAIEESGALAPVYEKPRRGPGCNAGHSRFRPPVRNRRALCRTSAVYAGGHSGRRCGGRFRPKHRCVCGDAHVAVFPMRCDYPFAPKEPDARFVARRAHAAWALQSGEDVIVVASAASLMRALPPAHRGSSRHRCGRRGGKWSMPLRVRCSISNRWPMRS